MVLEENLLSLNVRGLRSAKKRREIFRWLKRYYNGKNSLVFLQETHSTKLDEKIWEKEWGSKILYSHGTSNSRGVAILLPETYNFEILEHEEDPLGRKNVLCLNYENEQLCFINVYFPTQDHVNEQHDFLELLVNDISQHQDKSLIIGGDFNTYLTKLDCQIDNWKPTKISEKLHSAMEEYNLTDIWRVLNPNTRRYTWRKGNPITQSRIDYWLIATELSYDISHCDINASIKSDHSLISLKLRANSKIKKGSGLWKFNTSLLSDDVYVDYMKGMITRLKQENDYMENKSTKWEFIKMEMRNATISYSKIKAKHKRQYEALLVKELECSAIRAEENPCAENRNHYINIKTQFEDINAEKTEGLRIRSKAQEIEEGERGTKYFLNLEKRNAKIKNITKLKLEDNSTITDPKQILNEQRKFYANLYKDKESESDFDYIFLNDNLPKLTIDEMELCDKIITKDELKKAVNQMKTNKSPGTDGFQPEFYKYFWDQLGDLLHDSITYAFLVNTLSSGQKRAVLRLIPKKDKDITQLKNWRPISLLNSDYKILTQVLSIRLQKVLSSIISLDQSGYLKNRFIGLNIRTIMDIISDVQENDSQGLLAFLDFEKAFDKIKWSFMHKCLEKCGFGQYFKKWIKVLYTGIESCVINNGVTSEYFSPSCGIRQGCPLSALLFIIAVETLSIALKSNKNIHGIVVNQSEFKITQLADDTTLLLNDVPSLQIAMNLLFMFHKSSGLKLNVSKTEILQLGRSFITNRKPYNLQWDKKEIYALGSWFTKT